MLEGAAAGMVGACGGRDTPRTPLARRSGTGQWVPDRGPARGLVRSDVVPRCDPGAAVPARAAAGR
ncbi:hypothetical protein GCM10010195_58660 [Kitasatospora griseola]|nr:hypothetical protein GCM10010195_58660 [Kitasatospora griseola]